MALDLLLRSHAVEILFARHAEPAWDVDGLSQQDPDLTERGRRQASLLAARLADEEDAFTELLVSPATRSRQTAEPIAEATGLSPKVVDDLVEIRMPDWSGTTEERVQEIFRHAYQRPVSEWWDGLPGGESFRDFHDRVCRTLIDILAEHSVIREKAEPTALWKIGSQRQKLLIVAHGGTNATALGFLIGAEPAPWEWERLRLGHASIARLVAVPIAGDHILSMRSLNDAEHLPSGLRTH